MPQVEAWFRFGWHGINLDVPADWELRRFHGVRRKGYARLVDTERVRLELRWDRAGGGGEFSDLTDRFISKMAKREKSEVERHTGLAELEGKDVETYTVRPGDSSKPSSYQMISRCRECGRIVMARVPYQRGENIKAIARRVFGSMQDHSHDGSDVWAAYDLRFAVPETMKLEHADIYPGSTDFCFLKGRDRIDVGRVALGSVILEKTSLEGWFRTFARKRFKKVRFDCASQEIKGHEGLMATGRLKRLGALLPGLLRRQRFHCDLWHCPVSDRLYFFGVLARRKNFENFVAYSARVVCH